MEKENIVLDLDEITFEALVEIVGQRDEHLNMLSEHLGCNVYISNHFIVVDDPDKREEAARLVDSLRSIYVLRKKIDKEDVSALLNNGTESAYYKEPVISGYGNRQFFFRSHGQKNLYDTFMHKDITIVTGPAGSGKTFLAVVYACNMLKKGLVRKIIITRPVVEAGESLGFLPGDLKEKVDPYLRPIYDSFEAIFGPENVTRMMERGIIEVAPLAYMRGRTLNDAIVILDEAQNTTNMQIKMFLTRLGFNSKMIITGDITQVDLPFSKPSGLLQAIELVKGIDEIAVVEMSKKDIVRHPVVQKIIEAYEKIG